MAVKKKALVKTSYFLAFIVKIPFLDFTLRTALSSHEHPCPPHPRGNRLSRITWVRKADSYETSHRQEQEKLQDRMSLLPGKMLKNVRQKKSLKLRAPGQAPVNSRTNGGVCDLR